MTRRFLVGLFWLYGQLPKGLRRRLVRMFSPKYTVGALCIVEGVDGSILLVRHSYNRRWGTVGGMAKRGERPELCAVREAREEVGIDLVLEGEPAVVVVPELRRVDVVFLARPAQEASADRVEPCSAEILEVRWFPPGDLPELSKDTVAAWAALARTGRIDPPMVQGRT